MSSARGGAGGGSKPASAGRQRARRRSRADTREQRAARPRSGAKRRTSITGGAEKQRGRRARRRSSAAAADDDLGEDELAEDHSAGWQARLNVAISNAKKTGILDLSSNLTGTCFRFDLAVVPQVVFTQLGGPAKDGRAPLRDLWLSNNLISSVPLSLAKFQDLKVLSFANNDIESFPLAVCALTQLESLHLNGNQLSAVPPQLERLQSLVEVRLDDNELSRFPTALTKLRKLRSLNLSFNDIDSIPADIRRLGSLVQLDLDNNRIGPAVPRELLHLRSLRVVGLANNHLEEMPPFGKVSGGPELEVLRIEGNRSGSFAIRHESGMLLEGVNSAERHDGYLKLREAALQVMPDGSRKRVEEPIEGYLQESVRYNIQNANWIAPHTSEMRQVLTGRAKRMVWKTTNRVATADGSRADQVAILEE